MGVIQNFGHETSAVRWQFEHATQTSLPERSLLISRSRVRGATHARGGQAGEKNQRGDGASVPHSLIVAVRARSEVDPAAEMGEGEAHVFRRCRCGRDRRRRCAEMLKVLESRRFPVKRLVALASRRSAGQKVAFSGGEVIVEELTERSFDGVQIALFSAGASVSREMAPAAASAGAVVIDNSSAWRMNHDVPLVVPEVNMEAAAHRPKGIIANPNCSTIQMVVALKPLHDAARIRHLVVSTYQATSGKGHMAVEELLAQTRAILENRTADSSVFPGVIAFNVLLRLGGSLATADYSREEEWKMVYETRKILGDPSIGVSPTTVRVPVINGHAEAVHVQFHRPMHAAEAKRLLRHAPGVVLLDEPYAPGKHPQPIHAAGTDAVYVGRVRDDLAVSGAINLFIVSDNLRKGAALNAVQIAEQLRFP